LSDGGYRDLGLRDRRRRLGGLRARNRVSSSGRVRAYGLAALRVIDASVMPCVVSGNTNAAVVMIAEKGGGMVLEDAR